MPNSRSLDRAVILFDRPVVGGDGHRPTAPLPAHVSIRGVVDGIGPVTCIVAREAVQRLCRLRDPRPAWSHLERAWSELTVHARKKIRSGAFEPDVHQTTQLPWIRLNESDFSESGSK
jgi:hypothetical protein